MIAEHNASTGAVQVEYIWLDDLPVEMIDSTSGTATAYAIHTGQIDEPLALTNSSAAIAWNAYVDPFGTATPFGTPTESIKLRLPGQWAQGEANTSQNHWRDYDRNLGRYIEGDPVGIDGGQNVYAYVEGDPLNEIDPSGLFDPRALTIAERAALGEEAAGLGPEDPFADLAAGVTLGVGLVVAAILPNPTLPQTTAANGIGTRARNCPSPNHDDECEELLRRDMINCQIVMATKGAKKAAACRSVANERYSECLAGGLSNVRTPPYWGN